MNDYYSSPADVAAATRARSGDINTIDQAISDAFDKLPSESNLKKGTINYAVTAGTAAAYTVALPHAPAAYTDGMLVSVKLHAANTGANPTINVDGLGAKTIKRVDGGELAAGDMPLNGMVDLRYNADTGFFHMAAASTAAAHASTATAQATIATTQAGIATTGANTATTKAGEAAGSATTATTQAGIATTKAGEASGSATTATTQAGIATTKAGEALGYRNEAQGFRNEAEIFKNAAEAAASTAGGAAAFIDSNPIVKGSADATKQARIEVDTNVPTATTVVLTAPAASGTLYTAEQALADLHTMLYY